MKNEISVLIVQPDIIWESPVENFRAIEDLTRHVDFSGVDLMLMPEMFSTGFTMSPETAGGKAFPASLHWMQDFAQRKCVSLLGSTIEREGDCFYNTAFLVAPNGSIQGRYRKTHPFGKEKDHYVAGDELFLFPLGAFTAAVFICYDLRFPEIFRMALSKGADLFFVMANWPSVRHHHWLNILTTRAIENQSYVCACNRTGSDPALEYWGGSGLVSPDGTEEFLGESETAQVVRLEKSKVIEFRELLPCIADRRPDFYAS